MSLKDQINTDIKNAMRAKESDKLAALRAVKAAIIVAETAEGSNGTLSSDEEISLLSKLVKQRKDAAELYNGQDRSDLAEPEEFQANVISVYLPAQMSEDEVREVVQAQIAKVGASGPSDMGKVMGPVMGQLKGKADGKMISTLVKEELNK
ncbi:MAG: GatB/YqeY domain-containing protein [Salibacteraceae bacterium]